MLSEPGSSSYLPPVHISWTVDVVVLTQWLLAHALWIKFDCLQIKSTQNFFIQKIFYSKKGYWINIVMLWFNHVCLNCNRGDIIRRGICWEKDLLGHFFKPNFPLVFSWLWALRWENINCGFHGNVTNALHEYFVQWQPIRQKKNKPYKNCNLHFFTSFTPSFLVREQVQCSNSTHWVISKHQVSYKPIELPIFFAQTCIYESTKMNFFK